MEGQWFEMPPEKNDKVLVFFFKKNKQTLLSLYPGAKDKGCGKQVTGKNMKTRYEYEAWC